MPISRRDFNRTVLTGIAATTVAGTGACGSDAGGTGAGGAGGGTGGAGGSACTLYAQQAEGPFYIDLALLRSDIRGGKTGAPFTLRVQVQDKDCAPLKDVAVDVWHCDAEGVYSGFPNQLGGLDTTGETFLRGTQVTDAEGATEFTSIYPGWYPGRTTHVHFKVHTSPTLEATSQIYFPEDVTSAVYETAPYSVRGPKDTPNADDNISNASPTPLATMSGDAGSGLVATILVTVA